jgi:hypothetical protein
VNSQLLKENRLHAAEKVVHNVTWNEMVVVNDELGGSRCALFVCRIQGSTGRAEKNKTPADGIAICLDWYLQIIPQ